MKKQTAVEWLEEKRKWSVITNEHIEEAKAMEKEQIIEAVNYGFSDWGGWKDSEEYYTSTYGQ